MRTLLVGICLSTSAWAAAPCVLAQDRFCPVDLSGVEAFVDMHPGALNACGIRLYPDSNFAFKGIPYAARNLKVRALNLATNEPVDASVLASGNTFAVYLGKEPPRIVRVILSAARGTLQAVVDADVTPEAPAKTIQLVALPLACP